VRRDRDQYDALMAPEGCITTEVTVSAVASGTMLDADR
jgi:hypothetical protein